MNKIYIIATVGSRHSRIRHAGTVAVSRLKQLIPLAALAISLVLSACEDRIPVPPPVVQANPSIKERYEIVVDVGSLPVKVVSGRAFFNIVSEHCIKTDYSHALGGSLPAFTQVVDMRFQASTKNQFVATLIRDPFKEADYFAKGICHWDLTEAEITLAEGVPEQHMNLPD